jgi:(1->4)-alpha-D-glucan 1-alpha-D-glucosylmutase
LIEQAENGRVKMFLTGRALEFRNKHRELFEQGSYEAVNAEGQRAEHVISFARGLKQHSNNQADNQAGKQSTIIVATRFFTKLPADVFLPGGEQAWGETIIRLGKEYAGCYRDALTGATVCAKPTAEGAELRLADVCAHLPVALLEQIR